MGPDVPILVILDYSREVLRTTAQRGYTVIHVWGLLLDRFQLGRSVYLSPCWTKEVQSRIH